MFAIVALFATIGDAVRPRAYRRHMDEPTELTTDTDTWCTRGSTTWRHTNCPPCDCDNGDQHCTHAHLPWG